MHDQKGRACRYLQHDQGALRNLGVDVASPILVYVRRLSAPRTHSVPCGSKSKSGEFRAFSELPLPIAKIDAA